jgi:hypothetical protein
MRTTVTVETMRFYASHGITEEERFVGGIFLAGSNGISVLLPLPVPP